MLRMAWTDRPLAGTRNPLGIRCPCAGGMVGAGPIRLSQQGSRQEVRACVAASRTRRTLVANVPVPESGLARATGAEGRERGTLDQLKLSAELLPIMMDGLLTPKQPRTLAMDLGRREQYGHWAMVLCDRVRLCCPDVLWRNNQCREKEGEPEAHTHSHRSLALSLGSQASQAAICVSSSRDRIPGTKFSKLKDLGTLVVYAGANFAAAKSAVDMLRSN